MASVCVRSFCQKRPFVVIQQYKLFLNLSRCSCTAFNFNNYSYGSYKNRQLLQQSLFTPLLQHSFSEQMGSSDNDKNSKQKLSLFQRFKQMYRDYWYVLVPVHLVTSAAWFGGFYYLAKSGVDVVALLEYMHISDKIVNPLRDSSLGYIAVSYALYKIATPLRYTVTLGGTTVSIKYLKEWGYIKPVPSKEQLKEMYKERKDNLIVSVREKKEELIQKKDQLKDKKDAFVDNLETSFKKKLKGAEEDLSANDYYKNLGKKSNQSLDDNIKNTMIPEKKS